MLLDSLDRLCFISFVAIPRIVSTSTVILMSILVIAGVGEISVYDSKRLKKFSMRENRLTSVS